MCHNVKKKNNTMMYKKKMMYIMCHNVKSTILLWTDVINYDYVNYVINVWGKKTITWWCTKKRHCT